MNEWCIIVLVQVFPVYAVTAYRAGHTQLWRTQIWVMCAGKGRCACVRVAAECQTNQCDDQTLKTNIYRYQFSKHKNLFAMSMW